MKNFKDKDVMVSIICNTYNHEKYIADAIEGFLMQKTDFNYEILIHDDASTDKTAETIRYYEKKYPDRIKAIYQEENQLSKGVRVALISPQIAKGEYLAICEGDDYWLDPNKLSKQVDFLENNPDYSACVHSALSISSDNGKTIFKIRPARYNKVISIQEIITGRGGFIATNSIMYRKNKTNIRPDFYYKNKYSFGDYQLIILLALLGKVYYFDEVLSVYRNNVPGSWTARNLIDIKSLFNHMQEVNSMLEEVNEYTDYAYDFIIQKTIKKNEVSILIHQGKIKEVKSGIYKNYYSNLDLVDKIAINLKHYSPNLYSKLFFIRDRILNIK